MQRLIYALLALPLFASAQTGWVNLEFQADQYGSESSWEIYMVGDDSVFALGGPYDPNSYNEQFIELPAGEYNLVVSDEFGDGICCEFGAGWFGIENTCGVSTYVYDFETAQITVPFNVLPCPPPVYGCMDADANNYDSQAYFDANNCLYDVTFRLDLNGPHPPEIDVPEVNSSVNAWCGSCWPMSDDNQDGVWDLTVEMPEGQHLWKFSADEWEVQELPVGVSVSPCFLFDEFGYVNRTINVQGHMVLPPFCWESCLPCGSIPGCTNPNADNWSPWANFDNGSCTGLGAECQPWETEITTVLILDNYPEETAFNVHNVTSGEDILNVSIGNISQSIIGVPFAFPTCVTTGDVVEVEISDSYGDGLGASQWGGQDGDVFVIACGDTLWELPEPDFGYSVFTEFTAPLCLEIEDVVGCGNPDYIEYNPNATIFLEALCQTPVVFGCTDDSYFNYDSLANTDDAVDSCFYTLTITDGVGDGWFGSWLGIYQDGWTSPQYKMGPNDGTEESFDVYLSSEEEIELFFFTTPQSQNQVDQCGFMLVGPTGDTLVDVSQWNVTPFPNTYTATPYCGNSCIPFVYGCTDEAAQNYMEEANAEDNSCYYNAGCTQAGYLEYYTQGYEADYDDGSCITLAVFGCTDPEALNYDPEANVNIDSCLPVVEGCMDIDAYNYNEEANTPTDDCVYDAGCVTGPGSPYWANDYCYSWVIEVDPYCCEVGWDGYCIDLHEYCSDGVTDVTVLDNTICEVNPNPTRDIVRVHSPSGAVATVYNSLGQVVFSPTTSKVISLGSLPDGVYLFVIDYENRRLKKKVVKQ